MVYSSPLANPDRYIAKVNDLSSEGIAIDKGADRARRDAAEFVTKYGTDFSIVSELKASTEQFVKHWVPTLQQTRDAASSISAWYKRFDQVFLSLIDDIGSEQDAKDVVKEFQNFLTEVPTDNYNLDNTPGVKNAFKDIEGLAATETDHVIKVLQGADWKKAVKELKDGLPPVKNGIVKIRNALDNYATKLE